MGTGIVSTDLLLAGHDTLSLTTLVLATAIWVVLALLLSGRFVFDRARAAREAASPAALTGVAGTAVLGTRFVLLGWEWAGIGLLLLAVLVWLGLLGPVLRHWTTPTVGASFVLVVSTESLAVLAANVAGAGHAGWLVVLALVALALGLGFYAFVVARFDRRQLLVGRGDHWVAGGALAISALACARVTLSAQAVSTLGAAHGALKAATLTVWALAMCWLPILVVAEFISRRSSYDVRRWSTVFPVGMYAACSFLAGSVTGISPITDFARIWTWVALGVWLVVLTSMLSQLPRVLRADPAPLTEQRARAESGRSA